MIGLLVACQLAAGGVVDVGIASEARAALVEGPDLAGAAAGALVLRPSVNAAIENEVFGASAAYRPALSVVSALAKAADPALTLLHVVELGGDLRLADRLAFRSALVGSYGDLDPVTAQALFQGSSSARGLRSTPFASLGARAGATAVLARRLSFDIDGRVDVTTALQAGAPAVGGDAALEIPLTVAPGGEAMTAWQITRGDALLGGLSVQGASVAGRGFFVGGGPVVGWRKQLLRQTGLELTGGVGAYSASDDQLSPLVVYIPTAQGRVSTLLDLSGEAALEAGARAGFNVVNDPLGTLIENRGAIGIEGGVRATRELAFRGSLTAATPAFAYAQRGRTASATYGLEALVAWAPSEIFELGAGVLGTTRIFAGTPVSDVQVALSLTARAPVLHTGGRPAGSGGGTTSSIGARRIGARPPLGASTIKDIEPLPPADAEPPPPELVPPSGVLPEAVSESGGPDGNTGPSGSKLRPLTDSEKREIEKKKKEKKDADEAAAAAEAADDKAEGGADEGAKGKDEVKQGDAKPEE